MNPGSKAGGFTLIEVMVAVAIVAIGMMAGSKVIGDTTGNIGYLRDKSMAEWIADNRITEIRLSGEFPSVDRTEGDIDYAGRKWHWVATVSQTPVAGLRRIDMEVRRGDDVDKSALVKLAGFVGSTATASGPSSTPWNTGAVDNGPGDEED